MEFAIDVSVMHYLLNYILYYLIPTAPLPPLYLALVLISLSNVPNPLL